MLNMGEAEVPRNITQQGIWKIKTNQEVKELLQILRSVSDISSIILSACGMWWEKNQTRVITKLLNADQIP
jgi:hypothetical protein